MLAAFAVAVAASAVACYTILRARAYRAERDAALGRAAAADDLASRLQSALAVLRASGDAKVADAENRAKAVTGAPDAAALLRDASNPGVLPGPAPSPQSGLPPASRADGRKAVPGFGR